jgi:branched-subunit amino acid transport protein AzlD
MEGKVPYIIMLIAAVGVLSWFIRAVPFLLFCRSGEPPRLVAFIGRMLSPAAIAMLVVYCFAGYVCDRPPADHCWCAAEAVAGTVTVALQWKWRNPPLSIAAGTVLYMMMVS